MNFVFGYTKTAAVPSHKATLKINRAAGKPAPVRPDFQPSVREHQGFRDELYRQTLAAQQNRKLSKAFYLLRLNQAMQNPAVNTNPPANPSVSAAPRPGVPPPPPRDPNAPPPKPDPWFQPWYRK